MAQQTPDALKWEAYIPMKEYPSLVHRAILFKGPALDYWHKWEEDKWAQHASWKDSDGVVHNSDVPNERTVNKFKMLTSAIDQDPVRTIAHHLIVFPETGNVLNNLVFSKDPICVARNIIDLAEKWEGDLIECSDLLWKVALGNGTPASTRKNA